MRLFQAAFLTAPLTLLAPQAHADDRADCLTAADRGQTLRDQHKLLEARDALRTCGRAVCPAAVQKDCITWAEQLDSRMSSVVFSATDAAGAPLTNVLVTLDGKVVRTHLDGAAVEVNPGTHTVLFDGPNGLHLEKSILAREGEKNAIVSVSLAKPAAPVVAAPPPPPHAVVAPPARPAALPPPPPPPPPPPAPGTGALGYAGWATVGVGVVGGVIGAVFGETAASDNNKAACNSASLCKDPQAERNANSAATVADIGIGVGVLLAAAGVTMVLIDHSKGAHVEAAPAAVGATGAGFAIRGAW